ncbi:hypothetical protein TTHERM_00460640 (macronuclear) [Tetrahymena thermophila SB210]|uniref:Kinesin motor domain-containing protein n=1 Tax=Tetrahymena thermophila (strain SB210) TaxID=312017 RepID=Q23Q20_TETTS|nr:hypothetical protein TTHERM_00460640 [Tetrahymena thermophila SB210]EAR98515.2 hypothetical protein TTHERM_00460640 [Tetrahymena thermophila SB210]|eukprot:XP_001018760.2 hypothetical protein TTHERM_00460640 [Tetrahymena thermophila SB210]
MDIQQQPGCNIQFIAKILEKAPQKKSPLKKKKSNNSLKSKSVSKTPSRSRSKSKDKKPTSQNSLLPKVNGNLIQIGKKLSKGQESFSFDKVFEKGQSIQEMYKAVFQPLVHQFVFENKNITIIHNGNLKSKQHLWINDVNQVDEGLYGRLIDNIFDQITLKNIQNGDGQLITVKMSFFEVTNFQENIVDFLNDHSPYQNMENMIVSREIFDLDDFLEVIQYVQENNLLSINEKQGKTQICKIRLQGVNSNCEMNFINLEEIDYMSKENEEYYCGFFKEIKDTYITQGIIQSKNTKFYNFSRMTQLLQSAFNQNSALVVLSSFVSDSSQHLDNLQGLKLTKRFQNIFKFEDDSIYQTKQTSALTTNYNTNDPNLSNQQGLRENNPLIQDSAAKNIYGSNNQSSPAKYNLFSNQNSNFQSINPYEEQSYPPMFGQTHRRSKSSLQFVDADKNILNNNSLFNSYQLKNPQIDQINQEIDRVNESIQNPPVAQSAVFTKWIKSKAEFIENILTNICQNKQIDGDNKNLLLDKVLNLKSQLQNLNENQNSSPRSLPDRFVSDHIKKRTSSSPDLKQSHKDNLFEYFETPRFELDGRRRMNYGKRVSLTNSDQKIMSGNTSIKSVIKSPSSKNTSTPTQAASNQFQRYPEYSNYYNNNMKPVYDQRKIRKSEEMNDSIDEQDIYMKAMKKKQQQKTINFKGAKKSADKSQSANPLTQRKSSLSKGPKRKKSTTQNKEDNNNSQVNMSTLSRKSTQSRKSILSKKSATSQKSVKSAFSQKSQNSKKSVNSKTSKKSATSNASKQKKNPLNSSSQYNLLGKRKSSNLNVSKNITSKRSSLNTLGQNRQQQLKVVKSPKSLNRSRSSAQGDSTRNYKEVKDNLLKELDFKILKTENSPSISHSRKTSLSKSPKFTPRQLNVPVLRGRSLSRDFNTQSLDESQNQSYGNIAATPLDNVQQNFQNVKIKDHLKLQNNNLLGNMSNQNIGNFSQAISATNLLSNKNNLNNLFSARQSTQAQIRQNIKEHLKTFRDLVESSSEESDYDLLQQISSIQPSMPLRKSFKFQSKVKEFDLSFEAEKKFFIEQQGKENQTELIKNYHKLLLKSYDIQKLLEEQVLINEELQKEVFAQEEKFNILQRKHIKKKREKQLIKKEMNDKLVEFEKMDQRDTQSRQQLQQQNQKMQNLQIQNEQQDKIIRNLEQQIQEIKESYESRIQEIEEQSDNQKIQIEKLSDIIKRNQQSEMDLRSQINTKSQQFDNDIKIKREEFERQLALNQLAIKQVQASKSVEIQSYEKKLAEAMQEVDLLKSQLSQMKSKFEASVQVQKKNQENLNNFRKQIADQNDKIEELEAENKQLKTDKVILQHKNSSIIQQNISQQIQSDKNIKQIEQSLLYYKTKQSQNPKEYSLLNNYGSTVDQEQKIAMKMQTPQHNSSLQKSIQNITTIPTSHQNMNFSNLPLQSQPQHTFISQQGYLNSSSNMHNSNNQNISVSQYEAISNRDNKSERNSQSPQIVSQIAISEKPQALQMPQSQKIDLNNLINTSNSTKISKKSKDGSKTKRIIREPKELTSDQQQLLSTQRGNKKSQSLSKSKGQQTARITAIPADQKQKKK